jgi:hypothetical protein
MQFRSVGIKPIWAPGVLIEVRRKLAPGGFYLGRTSLTGFHNPIKKERNKTQKPPKNINTACIDDAVNDDWPRKLYGRR